MDILIFLPWRRCLMRELRMRDLGQKYINRKIFLVSVE